jgi:hypothetical protein
VGGPLGFSNFQGMQMPQLRLITDFNRLNEADFYAKGGFITDSLTGNPDFPEPWSAPVPSLQQLRAAYEVYRNAYHAAQMRDRLRILERDEARQKLTRMLQQVAVYLDLVADGDLVKLSRTGFDLRREGGRPSGLPGLLAAPQGLSISPGSRPGTLLLQATALSGTVSYYEIQINQGQPDNEADWRRSITVTSVRRVLIDELSPGQVWVRMRGINRAGNGDWSQPISLLLG